MGTGARAGTGMEEEAAITTPDIAVNPAQGRRISGGTVLCPGAWLARADVATLRKIAGG